MAARSPEEVVRAFCAAWSRKNLEELLGFFTPDAVYHNMPVDPVVGPEAIRSVFEMLLGPAESVEFEIVNLAATGSVVHTERVDRFVINGRSVVLPVAGVFEIEGDRIRAWRDYFDMQDFLKQSGMG